MHDSGEDFVFTTIGGLSPATFSLDDDAGGPLSNTRTFTMVAVGTYTVMELAVDGFTTSLSCTDLSGGTSTASATATIGQAPGETVTCLYTNTAQPMSNLADLAIGIAAPNQLAPVGQSPVAALLSPVEAQAQAPSLVTYSLTMTNNGPEVAQNVSVTNPMPVGLMFVSNTGGCMMPFPCSLVTLADGQNLAITTTLSRLAGFDPRQLIMLTLSLLTIALWQLAGQRVVPSVTGTAEAVLPAMEGQWLSSLLLGQGLAILGLVLYAVLVGPLVPLDVVGAFQSGLLLGVMLEGYRRSR